MPRPRILHTQSTNHKLLPSKQTQGGSKPKQYDQTLTTKQYGRFDPQDAQAIRQIEAAQGLPIEWVIPSADRAEFWADVLAEGTERLLTDNPGLAAISIRLS